MIQINLLTRLKIIALYCLILLAPIAMANEKDHVEYMAHYRAHNIHCHYLVNGLSYQSTIQIGYPTNISFMSHIGSLLAEGKNSIGLYVAKAPGVGEDGYCEMSVTASAYNPESKKVESKEVTMLRVTLDKEGQFTVAKSDSFPEPSLTQAPTLISLDKKSGPKAEINDALATRPFMIHHDHNHHYSWTHALPFTDTPENREKLWEKYDAIRQAIAKKDEAALRAHLEPGASESERYKSDPNATDYTDSVLSGVINSWDSDQFKILPINRDDYELQIYADGRLFRFVHKTDLKMMESPIAYSRDINDEYTLNFTFTLVNGKIVVAFL